MSLTDFAKVVIDTNVLLSAALVPRSVPAVLDDLLCLHPIGSLHIITP